MEGKSDSSQKEALLGGDNLRRSWSSPNSLRREFVSKLPEKVRSVVDDVESPYEVDVSRISGLTKGEKEYYEQQFATLKSFEEMDRLEIIDSIDEEDDEERAQQERAMKISNCANILLLVLKIYATVRSLSIAIAASTLDSLLDLMAGGILWFTHLYMKKVNIYKYPIGKLRVQPVGIVVFAAIMATLGRAKHNMDYRTLIRSYKAMPKFGNLYRTYTFFKTILNAAYLIVFFMFKIMILAFEQLIEKKPSENLSAEQFIWLCSIMIFATALKLALWIYCKSSRNKIVRAYAKDHYFDVITNVIGLVAAILGDKIKWWIDPAGAIFLAIYTMVNWSGTVWENAVSLIGESATPQFLQKLTYLVLRHPQIQRVDTVRAYTFGVLYFVEVDIELPDELPLIEAHAIGETLQIKIEKLSEVERAFVHLDFECEHKPEHTILVKLPNTQA